MWLRPVPAKQAPANKTCATARPRHAHTRRTATRAAPMATRTIEHSGSGDDNDRTGVSQRPPASLSATCARATPSKIAHMIAPVDVAGGGAQSNARRRRPPTAPAAATPIPRRADAPGDPTHVLVVDRGADNPVRARRTEHGPRHEDHAGSKDRRAPHRAKHEAHAIRPPLRASAREGAHARSTLAAAATTTAAGYAPNVQTHRRTGRSSTGDTASVGERSDARGPTERSPLSLRNDGGGAGYDDDDVNDRNDERDGIDNVNGTDRSHTSDTRDGDSDNNSDSDSGDDEQEDNDSTEWAACQAATLARARCDMAEDQKRAARRLADALAALRAVMERAWARGELVSSSSVADVEARARAFLRAGCCCPWEPAVAPLGASLNALVGQLAIDRPQEPTPCFVALLDALTAAVRLVAASGAVLDVDDPAQTDRHAQSDSGAPRRNHQGIPSPGALAHADDDWHSVAMDRIDQDDGGDNDAPKMDRETDACANDRDGVISKDETITHDGSRPTTVSSDHEKGSCGDKRPSDVREGADDATSV